MNDDARLWADVCLHPIRLTEADRDTFAASPDATHPALAIKRCCLPIDHHGPHISRGTGAAQTSSVRWLRWNRERRELFDANDCHAPSVRNERHHGEPDLCQLPHGHDGPHDFDYTPNRRWPFPEEIATFGPIPCMESLDDTHERDRAEGHPSASGDDSGTGSSASADNRRRRARRPPPPLEVAVEVTYVKSESVAQAQLEAIKAVLEWARDQQKRDERNSTGGTTDA